MIIYPVISLCPAFYCVQHFTVSKGSFVHLPHFNVLRSYHAALVKHLSSHFYVMLIHNFFHCKLYFYRGLCWCSLLIQVHIVYTLQFINWLKPVCSCRNTIQSLPTFSNGFVLSVFPKTICLSIFSKINQTKYDIYLFNNSQLSFRYCMQFLFLQFFDLIISVL